MRSIVSKKDLFVVCLDLKNLEEDKFELGTSFLYKAPKGSGGLYPFTYDDKGLNIYIEDTYCKFNMSNNKAYIRLPEDCKEPLQNIVNILVSLAEKRKCKNRQTSYIW